MLEIFGKRGCRGEMGGIYTLQVWAGLIQLGSDYSGKRGYEKLLRQSGNAEK